MADHKTTSPVDEDTGINYEIKIKGHLEEHWSDWLGGLKITQDTQGYSLLTGTVLGQAALNGILAQNPRSGTDPDLANASKHWC